MKILSALIRTFFLDKSLELFLNGLEKSFLKPDYRIYPRTKEGILEASRNGHILSYMKRPFRCFQFNNYLEAHGVEQTLKFIETIASTTGIPSRFYP